VTRRPSTNFGLQIGEFVEAGKPVFSLIRTGAEWVQANFKETDLTYVRVGQPVVLSFDAYPGRVRQAEVASISPATGAEFALLPPQNALGNWVKVVQRLPVRLELTGDAVDPPLRAGMSVIVEIDTGHERALPNIVKSALAWVKSGT
jgi:membrane fusion protein (multidrug efflux system)